jgi:hypothetical protein
MTYNLRLNQVTVVILAVDLYRIIIICVAVFVKRACNICEILKSQIKDITLVLFRFEPY